jgi:2'-5' RNA ligase
MKMTANIIKQTDEEDRYFIAIIPPEPIYTTALSWKHFFAEHYQSKAALKSPPHITLHMPFVWKKRKQQELMHALQDFAGRQTPFEISVKDFAAFVPRVIFMQILKSEALLEMQQELIIHLKKTLHLFNANYKAQGFTPHLTLAFRDLKKRLFESALNEVKNKKFESRFLVKEIVLLKHNGKYWEVFKNFEL